MSISVLYKVQIIKGVHYYCFNKTDTSAQDYLSIGEPVIIQLPKHRDNGEVIERDEKEIPDNKLSKPSKSGHGKKTNPAFILRRMTEHDHECARKNKDRANTMFQTAERKINEHRLDMKLVDCHYSFDKSMVLFQFAADERVDFRNLVKDLAGALHIRVELKQIGTRDEAGIRGGIGSCGRPLCCSTILNDFKTVNIKMAKTQGLSLNPNNVSGTCGRLKCCLRYEVHCYRELAKTLPRRGTSCTTPDGRGKVI
ncbi:MAG: PSP1 domain-containing protein, partial [Verrucomicrobiota bacterium]